MQLYWYIKYTSEKVIKTRAHKNSLCAWLHRILLSDTSSVQVGLDKYNHYYSSSKYCVAADSILFLCISKLTYTRVFFLCKYCIEVRDKKNLYYPAIVEH